MPLCPPGVKTTIKWQYLGENQQQIIGADDYSVAPNHATPTIYGWVYDMGLAVNAASYFTPSNASLGCNNTRNPVRRCVDYQALSTTAGILHNYSGFYAPIYKYRVTDYIESTEPCIRNGSQALSIPCGLAKGCRKVEILCHGGYPTYSSTPVWLTAWDGTKGTVGTAYGTILQVPGGGEYSVNYESGTNRYVGVIPGSYSWQYFYFNQLNNVLPAGYLFKIFKNGAVVYQRSKTDKPTVTFTCGEECPPGTCQCDCGDMVCCYDTTTGRAVKSFKK